MSFYTEEEIISRYGDNYEEKIYNAGEQVISNAMDGLGFDFTNEFIVGNYASVLILIEKMHQKINELEDRVKELEEGS